MVQIRVLSGKKAGSSYVARRFPVRIGRGAGADLQLEEDGVWDRHLEIQFKPGEGFYLAAQLGAPARVNEQSVRQELLRNGDGIEIGAVKLQFWLSETRHRALRVREWLTWAAIGGISLSQVALIYWLLS